MSVTVRIPTPLRRLTQNLAEVETEGANIEGIIDNLEASYPGMKERLCDEGGNIRRFVNIYLNDEDIRFLDGKATAVADGAEISIIPAIAGGKKAVLMAVGCQLSVVRGCPSRFLSNCRWLIADC